MKRVVDLLKKILGASSHLILLIGVQETCKKGVVAIKINVCKIGPGIMMNRILPYGVTQDKCIKFQMVTELHLQLCFPRWTYQVLISLSLLQSSCYH